MSEFFENDAQYSVGAGIKDSTQIQESIFPSLNRPNNLASADPSLLAVFWEVVDSGSEVTFFFITEPTKVNFLAKVLLQITCAQ
jgi:hypothetical protein